MNKSGQEKAVIVVCGGLGVGKTEVQLYKSLLFLKRSVDRNLIITPQRVLDV